MIWIVSAVVYLAGAFLFAGGLHQEVEQHPKQVAAIILLWPIAIVLIWLLLGAVYVVKWLGLVKPLLKAAELTIWNRRS